MIFLTTVIQILLLIALAWTAMVTFVGSLARNNAKQTVITKYHKFAVVICAHNEGGVISQLLDSLAQQTYDKRAFHVFLLADHCTDNTAERGRAFSEVTVYERNNGERSGKGAVLTWGLAKIQAAFPKQFDVVLAFDADNIADKSFIERVNEAFCRGEKIVMGNRLSLNPYASVVSQWYTLYWHTVDILYCRPRARLGLSAILSGTGFAFALDLLGNKGWQTATITEDIEFSMQQNLNGVYAGYQENAIFYDEQPTTLQAMFSQLRRWCTGNFQIAGLYWRIWWQHFLAHPTMKLVDNFIPITLCVVFGFYVLISFCWLFYNALQGVNPCSWRDLIWWGGLYLLSVLIGIYVTGKEKFSWTKMLPGILTSSVYCLLFSLISVYSLFKPQKRWIPIKHEHKDMIKHKN